MTSATQLATVGFDYESTVKPLRLLGARTIHVSVFVSVEFPDKDLVSFLKQYGQLKSDSLRRLYYGDEGFTHIERGIRVAECVSLEREKTSNPGAGNLFQVFRTTDVLLQMWLH